MNEDKHESSELLKDLLQSSRENWRFQVTSYWQRNSYFAAFQTVWLAAAWKIGVDGYCHTYLIASLLGLLMTAAWWLLSYKGHEYVLYWWKIIGKLEAQQEGSSGSNKEPENVNNSTSKDAVEVRRPVAAYKHNRKAFRLNRLPRLPYSELERTVICLFGIAWLVFVVRAFFWHSWHSPH